MLLLIREGIAAANEPVQLVSYTFPYVVSQIVVLIIVVVVRDVM